MQEIKRPHASKFNVAAYFRGNAALTVSYTLQNLVTTSANYLKYWNVIGGVWATGVVANAMPAVVSNPGLYLAVLDHNTLTGHAVDDSYAVVVNENTTSYSDFFILRFGDVVDAASLNTTAYLIPKRKTVSRVTDTHVTVQSYDATTAGNLILQVDVVQDVTGTQPEETQTLTVP